MKKIRYIFLSILLSISLYIPCFNCYAQGVSWTAEEKIRYIGNAFYKIFTDISGVLVPSGLNGSDLQRDFQAYVLNSDVIQDNMTYDEWIASEIGITYKNGSSGDADITYSATFQNTVNNFAHDYLDEYRDYYYVYSLPANCYLDSSWFYNKPKIDYDNFISFIREHDDNFLYFWGGSVSDSFYIVEYAAPDYQLLKYNGGVFNANNIGTFLYKDWQLIPKSEFNLYKYTYSTHEWIETSFSNPTANNSEQILFYMYEVSNISANSEKNCIDMQSSQYQVFTTLSAMQNNSLGVQSYYVTDSYNSNWVDNSITDSYNTTTTAVNNTVSYQDVANYVNNYYVENNSYPTTNTVYNYINNYVPSDNGGGSSGSNGGDFDWSFLGTIGDFLGGLIEGVGNVLSGILSTLTDVIDMFIGENGLPNIISQLIAYFLPFLPEWIPTLIGFSVVLALILGIIKLIRG